MTSIKRKPVQLHHNVQTKKGQTFVMPSQTIQGETMTIQELFKRASNQGNFILSEHEGMYLDVPNIDEVTEMYKQGHDLTDLQKFADEIKALNDIVEETNKQKQKEAILLKKETEKEAIIQAHNDELNDKKATDQSEK